MTLAGIANCAWCGEVCAGRMFHYILVLYIFCIPSFRGLTSKPRPGAQPTEGTLGPTAASTPRTLKRNLPHNKTLASQDNLQNIENIFPGDSCEVCKCELKNYGLPEMEAWGSVALYGILSRTIKTCLHDGRVEMVLLCNVHLRVNRLLSKVRCPVSVNPPPPNVKLAQASFVFP